MKAYPALISWGIPVTSDTANKKVDAHKYVSAPFGRRRTFRVRVLIDDPQEAVSRLLDQCHKWDLNDLIDVRVSDFMINHKFPATLVFRSPTSAYSATKVPNIMGTLLDPVSKDCRAPIVYIQGIPPETPLDSIFDFFSGIYAPIKVKPVKKGSVTAFVAKFASTKTAQKVVEASNRQSFKGHILTTSYQYKTSVTSAFFVYSTNLHVQIPEKAITLFLNQIGEFETFVHGRHFYAKTKEIKDSRLACGLLNQKEIQGLLLTAVFIEPSYFMDVRESIPK